MTKVSYEDAIQKAVSLTRVVEILKIEITSLTLTVEKLRKERDELKRHVSN